MAIAFSARDTVSSTSAIYAELESANVPELLRPTTGALRVLRELDQLGIPLALFGALPQSLLERMAVTLWFSGPVLATANPLVALPNALGLPTECIWFVTADHDEAQRAKDTGFTAALISMQEASAIDAPNSRGVYVLPTIDDLLEAIRIPYTRAALNLRVVIGAVLRAKPDEAIAP